MRYNLGAFSVIQIAQFRRHILCCIRCRNNLRKLGCQPNAVSKTKLSILQRIRHIPAHTDHRIHHHNRMLNAGFHFFAHNLLLILRFYFTNRRSVANLSRNYVYGQSDPVHQGMYIRYYARLVVVFSNCL